MTDESLYIWDFINDKYICFDVDDENIRWIPTVNCLRNSTFNVADLSLFAYQIIMDGRHLILLDFTSIRIWDIPPLLSEPLQ